MMIPKGKSLQLQVQAMLKAGDAEAIKARCNIDPAFARCLRTYADTHTRVKTSSLVGQVADAARAKGGWKRW